MAQQKYALLVPASLPQAGEQPGTSPPQEQSTSAHLRSWQPAAEQGAVWNRKLGDFQNTAGPPSATTPCSVSISSTRAALPVRAINNSRGKAKQPPTCSAEAGKGREPPAHKVWMCSLPTCPGHSPRRPSAPLRPHRDSQAHLHFTHQSCTDGSSGFPETRAEKVQDK